MRSSPLLRSCTFITSFLSAVHAFTVGTPTQCDDLAVSWTGGQAPFQIMVTPFSPSQPFHNISVPASAFSNGKGSYSIPQFPFKDGTQFLLTISDNTGFGSGGTSTILTVGPPIANNNCNTTISPPDFFFSTPLQLQQCNDYSFTTYDGAVLPVTITGLIPGGEFVSLYGTGSSYTWVADVAAGTNLIFFMIDSQGRQGGVSPLNTVQPLLSNSSCLNINSPSSTTSAPSQTSSQSTPSDNSTATVGIIAGATVGGVVLLVLSIILGIWWIRKARRTDGTTSQNRTDDDSHLPLMRPGSQSHLSAIDPFTLHLRQISYADSFAGSSSISSAGGGIGGGKTTSLHTFPHQTLPTGLAPPVHPGTHSHLTNLSAGNYAVNDPRAQFNQIQPERLSSNLDAFAVYRNSGGSSSTSYSGGRMATAAAANPSPQIIVHTDIEDGPPPPDIEEVIELPPQYADRQPLQPPPAPRQKSSRF
ncbi:hypothetical protein K503DRAFT_866598 [Rhizopogon vinicolor AM-OR11-026]|uniref:Uncharacterized protein n=1 Tax=Rhizopogon vinicolor AM-OR11-026 TaxID=1314800 RepID=A0A1B7MYY8_9AGAM|nr:hypothetical protein K503DRAFT_866598 [Rhizopogon vinicolor AM-OR11-026]